MVVVLLSCYLLKEQPNKNYKFHKKAEIMDVTVSLKMFSVLHDNFFFLLLSYQCYRVNCGLYSDEAYWLENMAGLLTLS